MTRQAVQPFVPDRGAQQNWRMGYYEPARSRGHVYVGFSGSTTAGAAKGASVGASVGSVIPVIGTAVGAILGGIGGAIASAFSRQDQEIQNFDQASAIYHAQGASGVLNIANKYLVLAGLFDLSPSLIKGNIPIYKKYGRMGEGPFVKDMVNQIYSASMAGQISVNDTPQSIFNRIVLPWINSFGYGPMTDSNAELINTTILGMVAEYIAGLQTRWYSRGGDYGFGSLPPFALPGAYVAPTASVTPSPTVTAPTQSVVPADQLQLQQFTAGTVPIQGTALYVTKGTNGQFMKVPTGATFLGVDPATGGWIVQYASGQYILDGGSLHTYAPMPQAALPVPGTPAPTVQPMVTDPGISPQIQYVPTGGGGGGYYAAPPSVAAPITTSLIGGLSTQTLLLAGGAILALSLLLPHNMRSVRSAGRS